MNNAPGGLLSLLKHPRACADCGKQLLTLNDSSQHGAVGGDRCPGPVKDAAGNWVPSWDPQFLARRRAMLRDASVSR